MPEWLLFVPFVQLYFAVKFYINNVANSEMLIQPGQF